MRVQEALRFGASGLSVALETDDQLEISLRQLAAAREYRLTGDDSASAHILAARPPGASILPSWLADESRAYSQAIHKQGLRTRGKGGGKTGKDDKNKGNEQKGGRGRGAQGRGAGASVQS